MSRISESGAEWYLVDVTTVWIRKKLGGGAISIRSSLFHKLMEDLVESPEKLAGIKAAIYLSKQRPGSILVKLLPIPSEV